MQPLSDKLALEESSSDTINLPTLLRKMPRIHHVSSIEHVHSALIQSHCKTHFKLCPDQYADDYHSVLQTTVTPQKMSHQLPEPLQ